ncbi:unnamed protein product [Ceratitis capitata]|uniref:(Mediterranean fruit fly) hypothetical protein n=1 Tax=Ceratitis capitata TaxID=7213 RepID=A0A811V1I3_CERCA|nr:unnamed protein product [Ceratitis capitata]
MLKLQLLANKGRYAVSKVLGRVVKPTPNIHGKNREAHYSRAQLKGYQPFDSWVEEYQAHHLQVDQSVARKIKYRVTEIAIAKGWKS